MTFTKIKLGDIPYCYAVSHGLIDGREVLLFAAEADGPCLAFDAETFTSESIWEHPGGTMAVVPRSDGEILAIQRFYPGFEAKEAEIVRAVKAGTWWNVSPLLKLPYVHRFDILQRGGVKYILCCTVCSCKTSVEDWSSPGQLFAAELPDDMEGPIELIPIADGMTRNHGYSKIRRDGFDKAWTACDQGLFEVTPPERQGEKWQVQVLYEKAISDIALCDIDGDGVDELAMIEPFHGDAFSVYKRTEGGLALMYTYPKPMSFVHAIWGGLLRGRPAFIGGCRGSDRDLFVLRWNGDHIVSEVIEMGGGPSNVMVVNGPDRDLIAVANREIGEAAVFIVED
ncbi:hypothetical protein [Sediminispirochaeta smaragdinae]|jgi:hypothetical protein|uniref:FG-GAP repeat protein n=1 Tax=Sediminispirochaeta smaragdinae (strain DSM 11293 / JCM 15392 / SEBR 4228) TaxID=573413 RepID=E1RCQ1_SEDSS|nr:hypothetical protein [Sediminispirochaeta smaragdinae]ADK80131.1 conserved hypothetical protein [Sediminispirochaeta smaragdinae DSM 11293]